MCGRIDEVAWFSHRIFPNNVGKPAIKGMDGSVPDHVFVIMSVPFVMRGTFRGGSKISLEQIKRRQELLWDEQISVGGLKLFLFVPKMFSGNQQGGYIPRHT